MDPYPKLSETNLVSAFQIKHCTGLVGRGDIKRQTFQHLTHLGDLVCI